ncbi:MAG: hypothetical protein FWG99_07825 [Treponema sp.]|nr:hypothetical protein [Treponema sp.]
MKKILGLASLFIFISVFSYTQDKEQVINLLYEIDTRRTRGDEIVFIEEFNFGIPGGINWLVGWYRYDSDDARRNRNLIGLFIYIVDIGNKEIVFREMILLDNTNIPVYYTSWYQSLQGVVISNGLCIINDFNGDGFDEILQFVAGISTTLDICGYEPQTNKIKWYCEAPIYISRQDDQPPPVEFITYKGMYGFRAQYHEGPQVAGGPDWVPDPPSPRNNRWFFYTWNEDRREYVEVEEVNPAYIEETYVNTGEWRNIQPVFPSVLAAAETEVVVGDSASAISENSDEPNNRQMPFWVWAAIGSGALLIVCVVVIIKRKK